MAAPAKGAVSRRRALSAAPPPSFEACVVTYISQDRAFQRVFAETDIEGMKTVVREKLNLSPHTGVRLAQVIDGRRIDLEDDADFYAFQLGAQLKPELQVEASVITAPAAQLASPSVTATSINLERAPPPTLAQTEQEVAPQIADASTSAPPAKKKKKPRKSNLVLVEDDTQGGNKPAESVEPTTTEQAYEGSNPKPKAAGATSSVTTTEPSKKSKSKSKAATKSSSPTDQGAPSTSETSKQLEDAAVEATPVPPKSKGKKAAATTPAPAPTVTEPAPALTERIPETSPVPVDTKIPESRPKKRGRKIAQDAEQQEPTAPEPTAQAAVEPPVKKQRKSKLLEAAIDLSGTQSPVATSLPPPVRSKRRNSTVASIPDTGKPISAVGSATDILRRWGALSVANEANGSGAGPSTTTDAVDQNVETKAKAKRKRKKKDQAADDTSVSASISVSNPAETAQCLLCSSGPHEPLDCPLLSQRNAATCKTVEERIYHLEDIQGPARIHQMLIGRLRSWLKETKKQVEVRGSSD